MNSNFIGEPHKNLTHLLNQEKTMRYWPKMKLPLNQLLVILLLAFGLRLYGLATQNLWWDELKTWERAAMPLNEMLTDLIAIRDQMPLYYWLMRFWAQIGTDAVILRLFSVYLGTASVAFLYQIGRRLGGPNTACWQPFCWQSHPFTSGIRKKCACMRCCPRCCCWRISACCAC
jgi:hypothetical protein